jgi:pimeloyl-ACP methyl ester carboxylesterase
MIIRLSSAFALLLTVVPAAAAPQQPPDTAEHHTFVIANFHTESGVTLPAARIENRRRTFFASNDANDLILQARTWQRHDVGTTPGFGGDVERALRSIAVPVLYMPSETDLYFPIGDARFEAQFIPHVSLVPIPSLWGHPAGAGGNPADRTFLNETIGRFLELTTTR